MKNWIVAAFLTQSLSSLAMAGVCEIKTVREACPGKETESFKKCDGKKECSQKKKSASAEECQKVALKECYNSRTEITKSKTISATFDGKAVKAADGSDNFCKADRPDFNKCK